MTNKPPRPGKAMPIQRGHEITDPVVIARSEALAKQQGEARRIAVRVWKIALRVSEARRSALLAALASQLPGIQQMDFLEDMMRHLPAEVLRVQEEQLRPRRAAKSSSSARNGARRR